MAQETDASKDAQTSRPKWLGYAQLALILAAIGVALYFAQAPSQVERDIVSDIVAEQGKTIVSVVRPTPVEQALTIDLTGTVRLECRARITSEVGGRVVWISPNFRNGGSITANETFIRIDPAEYELRVDAAEMAVNAAAARVEVERARAEESAQSYALEHPVAEIFDWMRRLPWIMEAEAELEIAQAELKLAALELERTNISLPYDGRVISSDIEVGEFVGPNELVGREAVLGSVYRTDSLQVKVPIEERDLAYLSPAIGRTAAVRTPAASYEADVVRTSAVIAPKTRLATLFLKFAEEHAPDTLPLPGTFVEVAIAGPSHANVFVLPESAVRDRDSVWVVEGGVLKSVMPRALGYADGGVVVEAFDAGDGVVVGALPGAREGLAVEVADASSSG